MCFGSGKKPRVALKSSDLPSHWQNMTFTVMNKRKL
nr:MAG TPA: glycoside hydrolase family protein [Caudoviricetes sp.]